MSEPFLAEVRIFGFNFAPRGWALCDGQILPINQNQSLYSLLGTTYGGDGRTTFGLPELRGRTPVHPDGGNTFRLGERGGEENHVLTSAELPTHEHQLIAADVDADSSDPAGRMLAHGSHQAFGELQQPLSVNPAIATAGSSQGHNNMQPSLTVNFCIAIQGLFPSRN